MRLLLAVKGNSLDDIKNGIIEFLKEMDNKRLNESAYIPLNDEDKTEIDYCFDNGETVFSDEEDNYLVNPYGGLLIE